MMDFSELNSYAIIMIFPDGIIEKTRKDSRNFHMQYMIGMINDSKRLKNIIKNKNIYIPTNEFDIINTMTYGLDEDLANEGIITFHNIDIDDTIEDIEDFEKVFSITMPSELTDIQKEIMRNIDNSYDLSNSWYGMIFNDKIIDISYDDVKEMIAENIK